MLKKTGRPGVRFAIAVLTTGALIAVVAACKSRLEKQDVVVTESEHGFHVPSKNEGHGEEVAKAEFTQVIESRMHERARPTARAVDAARPAVREVASAQAHSWNVGLPDEKLTSAQPDKVQGGDLCTSEEFAGAGPTRKFSEEEWTRFTTLFYGAKGDLIHWLKKNQKRFPVQTADAMEARLRTVKLAQLNQVTQPDIPWRGTGVLTQDGTGAPTVEVGPGFAELMSRRPERARFEMMRLLAQTWSPCTMARKEVPQPWSAFLRCMKIDEAQSCPINSYSEGGWAVSTAIAQEISHPGCRVPAFAEPEQAECAKKFLLPLTLVSSK
jgi:hypothetical protein